MSCTHEDAGCQGGAEAAHGQSDRTCHESLSRSLVGGRCGEYGRGEGTEETRRFPRPKSQIPREAARTMGEGRTSQAGRATVTPLFERLPLGFGIWNLGFVTAPQRARTRPRTPGAPAAAPCRAACRLAGCAHAGRAAGGVARSGVPWPCSRRPARRGRSRAGAGWQAGRRRHRLATSDGVPAYKNARANVAIPSPVTRPAADRHALRTTRLASRFHS